ncbi:AraC-type DNA-binding protein [Cribrihabitans marinus]|uniref:AraC-type DNA-binding protein n=1 Tax=Cribrihabitans marinus TaxID=1227549 RepID=A0A1H7E1L2_9RHOB|nr:AraC family transcriptional regulator [Cribrihabitans marinus]GGH41633.1 transcriptional regulator [Cribrihabitans marinus]SEK07738.1 AraC-type DNA-binding protein [Cribrihabitans marinus]
MPNMIPLIQPVALSPVLNWMGKNGIAHDRYILKAGLSLHLLDEPTRPIPLLAAVRILMDLTREYGPNVGTLSVSEHSVASLGLLGRATLDSETPRQALLRMAQAYAVHSSHEIFHMQPHQAGATIYHRFMAPMDDESLHTCQQYVLAMVRSIVLGDRQIERPLSAISMVPHRAHGFAHFQEIHGVGIKSARDRVLRIEIPASVLDKPYDWRWKLQKNKTGKHTPINGDGTLTSSLRATLPTMLHDGTPTVAELAELAGTSPRTLQRRLAAEGVTLSSLIDQTRRDTALQKLTKGEESIGAISADLGFSAQSSLSRAMRRWTSDTPSGVRRS